jgi:hypothetical protein
VSRSGPDTSASGSSTATVTALAAALLPVAVWSAGAAHADTTDDQYLQHLASHSETPGSPIS